MKRVRRMVVALVIVASVATVLLLATCKRNDLKQSTAEKKLEIALIIKATDSDFWQTVIDGGEAFDEANKNVHVTVYGPPSEADIEESIRILEDVVVSKPDAIVIASQAGTGAVPTIKNAMAQGIPVVTIDTMIPTEVVSHLATDNKKGGRMAAEAMVGFLEENKIEKSGTIAILSAIVCDTDAERGAGFAERMKELAPNINVIRSRYTDNEVAQAMSVTEDFITTYDDLIGVFGIDYAMGEGIALAVEQAKLQDSVMVVAFDDAEAEIMALKNGAIKALVVQDPYGMGYKGCDFAVRAIAGEKIPSYLDTGVLIRKKGDYK